MPQYQAVFDHERAQELLHLVEVFKRIKRYADSSRRSKFPSVELEVYRALAGFICGKPVGVTDSVSSTYEYSQTSIKVACGCLMGYDIPLFFLDPQFTLAIEKTDLDLSFGPANLKMPYDSMLFVFDKDSMRFDRGRVSMVMVCRIHKDNPTVRELFCDENGLEAEKVVDAYHFFISSKLENGYEGYDYSQYTLTAYPDKAITIDDLLTPGLDGTNNSEVITSSRACRIAVGAILAMTCREDLITRETIHHWQHKDPKKRGNVAFWNPNIIGNGYQILGGHGNGTHASPRMHWRRGHFRNQACGVGRKDHRQVWLEPMLVAANTGKE